MTSSSTILISGAGRGLGFGLALACARRGWRVFGGCRQSEQAVGLRQGGVESLQFDVCDDASVRAACQQLRERTTGLDVLVNNAGINPVPREATIADVPAATMATAFDVNVLGALRLTQAALPLLRAGVRPRIVNISSGAGSLTRNPVAGSLPAYCISKAALNMLTRRSALDLPDIIVVSISPGWVRTDMGGSSAQLDVNEVTEALAGMIEGLTGDHSGQWLDRHGQPSEYAW